MSEQNPTVVSPCVSICALDSEDICTGCHRTAKEILGWATMNDSERRRVLENTQQRARAQGKYFEG